VSFIRAATAALLALALASCRGEARGYSTWASLGEKPGRTRTVETETLPPAESLPWTGTVSHHLLADSLLDRWFAELALRRKVELFYILSPSHWGLSTQAYSCTDGYWRLPGGVVKSDRRKARALAKVLGVPLEPGIFDVEHGVSTLMPYIAKYFPGAKVIAVAYRGEPPLDQPMADALARALAPEFDGAGKARNFLLVSTDFAHHGNRAGTKVKDDRSRRFFNGPSPDTWIFAGCDNRPGIYALAKMLEDGARCGVLFHSDSLELSGHDPGDITSYFFTFFWDP
jgi:predicted class III extradiol MEMO1 family dioxygenase